MRYLYKGYSQSNYVSGQVKVNERACTGCKQCNWICPASALEMSENRKSQMKAGADCISCGACMAVCAHDAIRVTTFFHVPDGAYKTVGRRQSCGKQSFPRAFETPTRRRK